VPNLTPDEQAQLLRDMLTDPAVLAEARAAMRKFYDSRELVFKDEDAGADATVEAGPEEAPEPTEAVAASPAKDSSPRRRKVDPALEPLECHRRSGRRAAPTSSASMPPSTWASRVEDDGVRVGNSRSDHAGVPGAIAHGPDILYPGDAGWYYWNAALAGDDVAGGQDPPSINLFNRA
jgi:hypothetical protein